MATKPHTVSLDPQTTNKKVNSTPKKLGATQFVRELGGSEFRNSTREMSHSLATSRLETPKAEVCPHSLPQTSDTNLPSFVGQVSKPRWHFSVRCPVYSHPFQLEADCERRHLLWGLLIRSFAGRSSGVNSSKSCVYLWVPLNCHFWRSKQKTLRDPVLNKPQTNRSPGTKSERTPFFGWLMQGHKQAEQKHNINTGVCI